MSTYRWKPLKAPSRFKFLLAMMFGNRWVGEETENGRVTRMVGYSWRGKQYVMQVEEFDEP